MTHQSVRHGVVASIGRSHFGPWFSLPFHICLLRFIIFKQGKLRLEKTAPIWNSFPGPQDQMVIHMLISKSA